MEQRSAEIAGLHTIVVGSAPEARIVVALLHGYAMDNTDLVPFAHSMQLPALFLFPRGPHAVQPRGYSWWPLDAAARDASLQRGPRDLHADFPEGRDSARRCLQDFLEAARDAGKPLVLAGFSQGGMLACEAILNGMASVDGLALLSASRLAFQEWQPLEDRMRGLPVLVSHGRLDDDLDYAAGERLRDWLQQAGAQVTWVPFEGGHQIPLAVWRQLRKFLTGIQAASPGGR